ncbi:MAG: hypothetical protein H7326_00590 [Bdellovibrionaceae bacterium]|nr:hypothetical protein [Pseudobdellovibrionaceae bacterium]
MQFSTIKNFLKRFDSKSDKTLLYAFVALGIVALMLHFFSASSSTQEPTSRQEESFDVDTMIPAGFLLVPIQLSNSESLSSLAGQFALVDLYAVGDKGRKGFKVASAVKLLRAPLNPQQFAVLIRENESSKLVTMEGPFFAALKNRSDSSRSGLEKSNKSNLVIHYGE